MITFSKLEKKGNLGNQLFQIASTIGIAELNNHSFCFPKWKYGYYFENQLPLTNNSNFDSYIEKQFHFKKIKLDNKKNYDLQGWFQSEKYFNIKKTKEYFTFKKSIIHKVKNEFSKLLEKETILISIRRGDFVDHKDYFQLPIGFYLGALFHNFRHWRKCNIVVMSDDFNYCKYHFSSLDNVYFSNNLSGIEQLILASLCNHFIISNSTFSWWCAWFGEKENSKIIRPLHNFTKVKNLESNDKNYFPDRWSIYNHLNTKFKLHNVQFLLRNKNSIIENHLNHNFIFDKIMVQSQNASNINENNVLTSVYINDMVIPPLTICEAVYKNQKLNQNVTCFLNFQPLKISKVLDRKRLLKQFDFGIFTQYISKFKENKNKKLAFAVVKKSESINNFHAVQINDSKVMVTHATLIKGLFYFNTFLIYNYYEFMKFFRIKVSRLIAKIK